MPEPKLAPSGMPLRDDMSVMELYGVYPQDLLGGFEPLEFPPRECRPITKRRSRAAVLALLEDSYPRRFIH